MFFIEIRKSEIPTFILRTDKMKKLIKLLNEWLKYEEKFWPDKLTRVAWIDDSWELLFNLENWYYWKAEYVISKRCGFIQRLVKNDKIDFDKCWLDIEDYLSYSKRYDKWIVMAENYDNDTFVVREFYSPYEQLLMLLSIQDNPIEFLISILK